jgi:hypothetical protein
MHEQLITKTKGVAVTKVAHKIRIGEGKDKMANYNGHSRALLYS